MALTLPGTCSTHAPHSHLHPQPALNQPPRPLLIPPYSRLRAGGNSRWVARLCEGLPIFYNSPVREITYGDAGVEVHAGGR